jgi:hypothetical protein
VDARFDNGGARIFVTTSEGAVACLAADDGSVNQTILSIIIVVDGDNIFNFMKLFVFLNPLVMLLC